MTVQAGTVSCFGPKRVPESWLSLQFWYSDYQLFYLKFLGLREQSWIFSRNKHCTQPKVRRFMYLNSEGCQIRMWSYEFRMNLKTWYSCLKFVILLSKVRQFLLVSQRFRIFFFLFSSNSCIRCGTPFWLTASHRGWVKLYGLVFSNSLPKI